MPEFACMIWRNPRTPSRLRVSRSRFEPWIAGISGSFSTHPNGDVHLTLCKSRVLLLASGLKFVVSTQFKSLQTQSFTEEDTRWFKYDRDKL